MITRQRSQGFRFLGLLTALFVGLKLAGVISWSWWLVFAPLLLPVAVVGVVLLVGFTLMLIGAQIS